MSLNAIKKVSISSQHQSILSDEDICYMQEIGGLEFSPWAKDFLKFVLMLLPAPGADPGVFNGS